MVINSMFFWTFSTVMVRFFLVMMKFLGIFVIFGFCVVNFYVMIIFVYLYVLEIKGWMFEELEIVMIKFLSFCDVVCCLN